MTPQLIGWLMMAPLLTYFVAVGLIIGICIIADFAQRGWWQWALIAAAFGSFVFGAQLVSP